MGIRSLKNGNTNSLNGANTSVAVPTEPSAVSLTASTNSTDITVAFTPNTIGASYTAFIFTSVSTSGTTSAQTSTNTSSYVFTGATPSTVYQIDVQAINANGNSVKKRSSNSVTTAAVYALSQTFTSSGTYTVPAGKTQLGVIMIGGGGNGVTGQRGISGQSGGGGAGGAGSKVAAFYDYAVTAGQTFAVVAGAAAGASSFGGTIATASVNTTTGPAGYTAVNGGTGGAGGTRASSSANGNYAVAGNAGAALSSLAPGLGTFQGGGGGGGGAQGMWQSPGVGGFGYPNSPAAGGAGGTGVFAGTTVGGNGGGLGGYGGTYSFQSGVAGVAGSLGSGGGGGGGGLNQSGDFNSVIETAGGAGGTGAVYIFAK